jgi:hypothetical protein
MAAHDAHPGMIPGGDDVGFALGLARIYRASAGTAPKSRTVASRP